MRPTIDRCTRALRRMRSTTPLVAAALLAGLPTLALLVESDIEAALAAPGVAHAGGAPAPAPAQLLIGAPRPDLNVPRGDVVRVVGHLRPALASRLVLLEARRAHRWATVASAVSHRRGGFRIRYRPTRVGSEALRVRLSGPTPGAPASQAPAAGREPLDGALATPPCEGPCGHLFLGVTPHAVNQKLGELNVYRLVEASWYGGGGGLACGGELTPGTMGVANRTLPCGTRVTLRYHGRSVTVPVIDRGPFVAGREFDLTEATKDALGFPDTGMLWSDR
jgi:rare lipoprotein A